MARRETVWPGNTSPRQTLSCGVNFPHQVICSGGQSSRESGSWKKWGSNRAGKGVLPQPLGTVPEWKLSLCGGGNQSLMQRTQGLTPRVHEPGTTTTGWRLQVSSTSSAQPEPAPKDRAVPSGTFHCEGASLTLAKLDTLLDALTGPSHCQTRTAPAPQQHFSDLDPPSSYKR